MMKTPIHTLHPYDSQEYTAQVTREEIHRVSNAELAHELRFQAGKADRAAGLPCLSANGAYLNGWYSGPETPFYYIPQEAAHLLAEFTLAGE